MATEAERKNAVQEAISVIDGLQASEDVIPAIKAIGEALRTLYEMADMNELAAHKVANKARIAAKGKPTLGR